MQLSICTINKTNLWMVGLATCKITDVIPCFITVTMDSHKLHLLISCKQHSQLQQLLYYPVIAIDQWAQHSVITICVRGCYLFTHTLFIYFSSILCAVNLKVLGLQAYWCTGSAFFQIPSIIQCNDAQNGTVYSYNFTAKVSMD